MVFPDLAGRRVVESAAVGGPRDDHDGVRVGFIGLGCAKNTVDAEVMLGHLIENGAQVVSDLEQAEVAVVNTCGFIEDAKRESIDAILHVAALKAGGSLRHLVVAGCMAQRYADELRREIPEIDAFVGLDELERITGAVLGRDADRRLPDQRGALRLYDHTAPRLLSTGGVVAYLKIAEGCSNPCAFCHIPRMRGAFRSRSVDSLVQEAQRLEQAGIRELVLVAQDTTRYGEDIGLGRRGLSHLLEALLARTAVPWLRVLYAYPATLDEGIFALMARERRITPYLDIPLQHASRKVLQAMRRGGDAGSFLDLIARARDAVPGLAVRSTFLVGFPGEGEEEFTELEEFVAQARLDHVGVFTYSFQEENPGAHLGDPVPLRAKERRRARLMRIQERISRENYRRLRGQEVDVLVDGPSPESEFLLQGRLPQQAPEVDGRVVFQEGDARPGDVVRARIIRTYVHDLVAAMVATVHPAPVQTCALLPSLPSTRPGGAGR